MAVMTLSCRGSSALLLVLLLSTCFRESEGFAPPLIHITTTTTANNNNNNNNFRLPLSAARPRTALAGSGSPSLHQQQQWKLGWASARRIGAGGSAFLPHTGRVSGVHDTATYAAPAASASGLEDPLAGDTAAVVLEREEEEEEGTKKTKKTTATPRKKMSPEEAAAKRKAAALKRKEIRDNMTPEEKAAKKEAAALKRKEKLANMTPEEKAAKQEAADKRKALKPKPTPEEVAARKEARALKKREQEQRDQEEQEEQEAKRNYERLAGASLTMADIEAGNSLDGGVIVSASAPRGARIDVDDDSDEFEGWEFVEDGEEDDETDEVPYWEGQAPEYDEDGALQGIDKGGVRVARAGLTVKDDTMGIKVPTDEEFHWYLLRTFATYEIRCRDAIESRLYSSGMEDRVKEIWVPSRQVPKQVGKTVTFKEEPIYQGYIYCHLKMDTQLRNMVNDMERIVGFVGEMKDEEKKLIPEKMDPEDIEGVRESERALGSNKVPKLLAVEDLVEISEGPFAMKKGEVSRIKDGEYVIKVNTFGRNSNVKLPWGGVRKLSELEVETWFEDTRRAMDATYMERERSGKPRAGRKRRRGDDFIYDDKAGYGPGRGRGGRGRGDGEERSTVGRGLSNFGDEKDDEQAAERRRFMEKDLEMWEAESAQPERRVRRPSGDKVDAQLPEEAFESSGDADDFFESLGSILGEKEAKGPKLPGARVQGPSAVERAHAVAEQKRRRDADGFDLFSSSDLDDPSSSTRMKPRGTTGSAGLLDPGVTRVSRDAPAPGGGSVTDDDDDDDLFSSLMKELKESRPASPATTTAAAAAAAAGVIYTGDDLLASPGDDLFRAPGGDGEGEEGAGVAPPSPPSSSSSVEEGRGAGGEGPRGRGGAPEFDAGQREDIFAGLGGVGEPAAAPAAPVSSRRRAGAAGDSEFEDLLAGLERGEGLNAAAVASSVAPPASEDFDDLDELFSDLGTVGYPGAAAAAPAAASPSRSRPAVPSSPPMQINGGIGGRVGEARGGAGTGAEGGGSDALAKGVEAGEAIINELLSSSGGDRFAPPDRRQQQQQQQPPPPRIVPQNSPQDGRRTGPRTISPEERQRFKQQQQQRFQRGGQDKFPRWEDQPARQPPPPPPPPPPPMQQQQQQQQRGGQDQFPRWEDQPPRQPPPPPPPMQQQQQQQQQQQRLQRGGQDQFPRREDQPPRQPPPPPPPIQQQQEQQQQEQRFQRGGQDQFPRWEDQPPRQPPPPPPLMQQQQRQQQQQQRLQRGGQDQFPRWEDQPPRQPPPPPPPMQQQQEQQQRFQRGDQDQFPRREDQPPRQPPPPPPPMQQQQQQQQQPVVSPPRTASQKVPPSVPRTVPRTVPATVVAGPGGGGGSGGQTKRPFSDLDLLPPVGGGGQPRGGGDDLGDSRQDVQPQQRQQRHPEGASFEEISSENWSVETEERFEERPAPAGAAAAIEDRFAELPSAPRAAAETEERFAQRPAAPRASASTDEFADIDAVLGGAFVSAAGDDGGSGGRDIDAVSPGVEELGNYIDSSSSSGGGGGSAEAVAATKAELGSMKVPELKERCKALGLKVGGKKGDLQARILEALE
ncbi:unnamed protein product [Pylaiella littoralis]